MAEDYTLPSLDLKIDRGVLNSFASKNNIDVNSLDERQQFDLYARAKAFANDTGNNNYLSAATIQSFRPVTNEDIARDPSSMGWTADGFTQSDFFDPSGNLSKQQSDYIDSTGKTAIELGQPSYFQNNVSVWNGMGFEDVSQSIIDSSPNGKFHKAVDPNTGFTTYYDNRAADMAAARIQQEYGGDAPDHIWSYYLRSPEQRQESLAQSQEYLRRKAASRFKLGAFIAKSLVPSIVGSGFGAAIGGAAGLSNIATQGLSGALSGGFSSGVSGNGLEGIALDALKGASTSIAFGQAKDALGLDLNPFSGDDASLSSQSISSEALLDSPSSSLVSAPISSESLLNAPVGSAAGFSTDIIGNAPSAEALLAAPVGGFAGSSGSFVSNSLSKLGLDKMSPFTLLAGAGLLGGTIYSTNKQADAAEEAARIQAQSGQDAINSQERMLNMQIEEQRAARDESVALRQPYIDAGSSSLDGLNALVNDPNAQASFIQDNPFYESLANDAQQRIFSNSAAQGKLGSGGTAEALQNSLVLLGQDLLNQSVQQKQNLATLGANAASGAATGIQNSASNIVNAQGAASSNITDLLTQIGNAQASGTVGAANAGTQGFNNLLNTALTAYGISQGNLLNI